MTGHCLNPNKLAVITGASRGLGRSMALHLARRGVDVLGTFNSHREVADATVAEIEAAGGHAIMLPLDVGQSADFPAFAANPTMSAEPSRQFFRRNSAG